MRAGVASRVVVPGRPRGVEAHVVSRLHRDAPDVFVVLGGLRNEAELDAEPVHGEGSHRNAPERYLPEGAKKLGLAGAHGFLAPRATRAEVIDDGSKELSVTIERV